MTESNKPKMLTSGDKQHTILPNEVDPKLALSKAMAAALKASGRAKKVRKLNL